MPLLLRLVVYLMIALLLIAAVIVAGTALAQTPFAAIETPADFETGTAPYTDGIVRFAISDDMPAGAVVTRIYVWYIDSCGKAVLGKTLIPAYPAKSFPPGVELQTAVPALLKNHGYVVFALRGTALVGTEATFVDATFPGFPNVAVLCK